MKRLLTVTLLCSLGGCAAQLREARQADLRNRASFDLGCPAQQIELTPLDNNAAHYGIGATGVRGCGRQATYLWDGYRRLWVMNDAGQRSSAQ